MYEEIDPYTIILRENYKKNLCYTSAAYMKAFVPTKYNGIS